MPATAGCSPSMPGRTGSSFRPRRFPERVKQAFIAAEDKNFYHHPGIDLIGIGRAIKSNLENLQNNRRPEGASTITQQVAKNFLLSNEVSMSAS